MIPKELWFKAMNVWRNNYKPRNKIPKNYLFKNLLYCGKCNKEIKLINEIYKCAKGCISINSLELTKLLLNRVINDLITSDVIQNYISEKINLLEKQIKEVDKELERIKKNQRNKIKEILAENFNIIDNKELKDLSKQYVNKVNDKSKLIKSLKSYNDCLSVIDKILEVKNSAIEILIKEENINQVQSMLSSIIERVVIVDQNDSTIKYRK